MRLGVDISKYCKWLAVLVLAIMAGCADSGTMIPDAPEPDAPKGGATISLKFKISVDDGNGSTTRAAGDDEETTPGTDIENAINMAYLIVEERDGGTLKRTPIELENLRVGEDITVELSGMTFGEKTFYVAANLSEEQLEAFCNDNAAYTIPNANGFDMVEAFAPDYATAGRQEIAMFCTEGKTLTLSSGTTDYVISESFSMKRLVAKVLVTCKTKTDASTGEVYCKLGGDLVDARGNDRGWIRLSEVFFILNGLNTKSYIMQRDDLSDPNYSISGNFAVQNGEVVPVNIGDFMFKRTLYHYDYTSNYMPALAFSEAKIPTTAKGGKGVYTEGLYCPENTFTLSDISSERQEQLASYGGGLPMLTHVTVTTLFTPKYIYAESGLNESIQMQADDKIDSRTKARIRTAFSNPISRETVTTGDGSKHEILQLELGSEVDAWTVLDYSMRLAGFYIGGKVPPTEKGLPDFTFYTKQKADGGYDYYTYGAAKMKSGLSSQTNKVDLDGFNAFVGGRGYFNVYVDNRKDSDPDKTSYQGYRYGSVERNVYYIITVDSFSSPGPIGNPPLIDVHTKTINWILAGEGRITLQ